MIRNDIYIFHGVVASSILTRSYEVQCKFGMSLDVLHSFELATRNGRIRIRTMYSWLKKITVVVNKSRNIIDNKSIRYTITSIDQIMTFFLIYHVYQLKVKRKNTINKDKIQISYNNEQEMRVRIYTKFMWHLFCLWYDYLNGIYKR